MRVLYVSKALVAAAYREKLRELGRHVELTAIMPDRWGGRPPEPSREGVPEPRSVPIWLHGHNHLHLYRSPGQWLDAAGPDLVHVDEEPYSLVTLQLALHCERRGLPFVFFAWQNLDKRVPPPFGLLRGRVYRSARGGIAGTAAAERVLRDTGYLGATAVIPQFGVDPGRFTPDPDAGLVVRRELGIPPDAVVVGYAGRLVPEKGLDVLLEAFLSMAHRGSGGARRLLIVGDGPAGPRLRRIASEADADDRVTLAGRVPSLDMPGHLAAMDVLVLPTVGTSTWSEQFGRVLVEAMACGVPVVASRNGEIPDVVGDRGDLVPAGDADALAEAIEGLLVDPGLRSRRADAGRRHVLERFTHERVAAETADFYDALLGGRP